MAQNEFLPICDVLFNIISLAAYFCEVVFDCAMAYALAIHIQFEWAIISFAVVILSSITQQIISLRWHLAASKKKSVSLNSNLGKISSDYEKIITRSIIACHIFQLGIFWRYFKLFIPVDLARIKQEVRDLCILRLINAFCQSMPLLLVQLYLYREGKSHNFLDLNKVSMALSLFSVCWALASFSKNVRLRNIHKLVLTWLGVIVQFCWRFGTISCRALTLVSYASLFQYWIFLVILLHWFSMFLWLLLPKNVFHGENLPMTRKAILYSVIAFVFTFAYINFLEVNHKRKMTLFYIIMGLENAMLLFVWTIGVSNNPPWYHLTLPMVAMALFAWGIAFMLLYYRYFHVRRLNYEAGGRVNANNSSNDRTANGNVAHMSRRPKEIFRRHSFSEGYADAYDMALYTRIKNESSLSGEERNIALEKLRSVGIPGVFNCRFSNAYVAAKRKRKKPTSFIPPPSINHSGNHNGVAPSQFQQYDAVPFWCRPLPNNTDSGGRQDPSGGESDTKSNIRKKLEEKKRKQLNELKLIEEQLRRGNAETLYVACPVDARSEDKQSPQYDTPSEVILDSRFLCGSESEVEYYNWPGPVIPNTPGNNNMSGGDNSLANDSILLMMYKQYGNAVAQSDVESQVSLPRSYTLPRQFKFHRRNRPRKIMRSEPIVPSTNSSDGDVDSGDESVSNNSRSGDRAERITKLPHQQQTTLQVKHETKL